MKTSHTTQSHSLSSSSSHSHSLSDQMPTLRTTAEENAALSELADTLIATNFAQYDDMAVSTGAPVHSKRWKELKRKEAIRVFKERPTPGEPLTLPSLLLLGTVAGTLEDVMYAATAHTDEDSRIKSFVLQDGFADSRVLCEIVGPTALEPFRHVQVKWNMLTTPQKVDFVSLDATGMATSSEGDAIGYHLMHSVDFERLGPVHGAKRGNMSVCVLHRQKTPSLVELYARGFYDVPSDRVAMSTGQQLVLAMAQNWLVMFSRKVQYAQVKKLAWMVRKHNQPRISGWSRDSETPPVQAARAPTAVGRCNLCTKSFGFLGTSRRTCRSCENVVCTRCCVAKMLVELSTTPPGILEKKRMFCSQCLAEAARGDAGVIAREEILYWS